MPTIDFTVNGQSLRKSPHSPLASGSAGIVEARFVFSSEWQGYEKTALFHRDGGGVFSSYINEASIALVPWEALSADGRFHIGVFGVKGSKRITSTWETAALLGGAYDAEALKSGGPSMTAYEGLLSAFGEGVKEAPKDGAYYARKDGRWEASVAPEPKEPEWGMITGELSSQLDLAGAIGGLATSSELAEGLLGKQPKAPGKGLSECDYTEEEKALVSQVPGLAPKSYVDSSIAAISFPVSYKGLLEEESGLPESSGRVGDAYYIADMDLTDSGKQGQAIWNGSGWDKIVDCQNVPDNATLEYDPVTGAIAISGAVMSKIGSVQQFAFEADEASALAASAALPGVVVFYPEEA